MKKGSLGAGPISESIQCICCGSAFWRPYCRVRGYDLTRCRACGFVRAELPASLDLSTLYGVDYFFGRGFDSSQIIPEARQPDPGYVARRRYWLTLLAEATGKSGRLLDVGCGAGALLDVARAKGWEAEGQEIAAAGAAEARLRGHRVQLGELPSCSYAAESFDAATMIEVIEHLPDPRPTLIALLRAVRPGGSVLITTGDVGSLGARLQRSRWSYIRPPGHVAYYTRFALHRLLESAGYIEVRDLPPYDLAYPSIPGRPTATGFERRAALLLRRFTRMELCTIAQRQHDGL